METVITVNGQVHTVAADDWLTLGELLRDRLGLTGTKMACAEGTCGTCTVLLDDRPVLSCLTLVAACSGSSVRTVEDRARLLDDLREAFAVTDGLQCGYCTPGQLMSAVALLERNPSPTTAEVVAAMSGNLCRCGAYAGIVEAVERVAVR
ncbi:MAG TPA: (2Fe-2S)-binding protein [Gaiellales bacterium]|nr:(2Fe-2S)-binding protein [Gaiellales bacterium]